MLTLMQGKYKDCPCIKETSADGYPIYPGWLDAVQEVIALTLPKGGSLALPPAKCEQQGPVTVERSLLLR